MLGSDRSGRWRIAADDRASTEALGWHRLSCDTISSARRGKCRHMDFPCLQFNGQHNCGTRPGGIEGYNLNRRSDLYGIPPRVLERSSMNTRTPYRAVVASGLAALSMI